MGIMGFYKLIAFCIGFYRGYMRNGKENGRYYNGRFRGSNGASIGILEKKMDAII